MNLIFDPSLVLYLPLHELDSGSLMSRDACGHACTVTGALWRLNVRDFDGIDDVIDTGAWGFSGNVGTFELWVKGHGTPPSTAQNLVDVRGDEFLALVWSDGGAGRFAVASVDGQWHWGIQAPSDVVWHHIVWVLNGTSADLYLDSVKQGVTQTITAFSIASSTAVGIGNLSAGGAPFDGEIGEVRIYSRALSPLEIQQNYLATKWRY